MSSASFSSSTGSIGSGDAGAADTLFAALYTDLHRMARREVYLRGGHAALSPTTLLHEAYLNISARETMQFPDRHRFMAYAARVMRGLVIDKARRRQAVKRGGAFAITALDTSMAAATDEADLQRMSDALDELAVVDAAAAEVVDLKFFCGFSFVEIAAMRGVSERTVQRQWEKARLYLHRALGEVTADVARAS